MEEIFQVISTNVHSLMAWKNLRVLKRWLETVTWNGDYSDLIQKTKV